jgi:hypothetical protein
MLDVILDCFGVLLLFGQAALFLVKGEIEDAAGLSCAILDRRAAK